MVLKMPRPTQRQPGTPFYFRARVPADVRSAVGKDVLSYSLGTTDEVEAKRLFAAEYASRWQAGKDADGDCAGNQRQAEAATPPLHWETPTRQPLCRSSGLLPAPRCCPGIV